MMTSVPSRKSRKEQNRANGQNGHDGKLEDSSIMDVKMEDRRATPRFRVQYRTTVSGSSQPEGTGIMLDLSRGGCRLESPLSILPGFSLELRVHVPGLEWPLMIDEADVEWVSERSSGLSFVRIRETEQQRLDEVLKNLGTHHE
jgi:hypothetical protein